MLFVGVEHFKNSYLFNFKAALVHLQGLIGGASSRSFDYASAKQSTLVYALSSLPLCYNHRENPQFF